MPTPRVGDRVWVGGLLQPNGEIVNIDWHDKEVHVQCYDTLENIALEWDDFSFFHEGFNQWIVNEVS